MSDLDLMAQNASSVLPIAELHGVVCGFAAGNPTEFSLSDFVQLVGTDALSDEQAVNEFVGAVLDELFAPDMDFVPLVPDDAELLRVRLTGIAQWTAGFLSGFGASFNRLGETMAAAGEERATRDALPLEVQEILQDFASISGLDEDVEGDEADEVSFMEIFEYVRVAVVLTLSSMPDRDQEQD